MKKKHISIAAAAAAVIVTAAGIAYGSGVPTKLKYWDEYKKTEDIDVMELSCVSIDIPDDWQDYKLRKLVYWDNNNDYEIVNQPDESFSVPDDCESYSITDISFKAPAGLVYDENDRCFTDVLSTDEAYKKDPTVRKMYFFGGTFGELGFTPMECVHMSLMDLKVDENEVNSLAKALGKERVKDGIDVYLVGAELGTSDFNAKTYRNAETFFKLGGELAGWGFGEHIRHYSVKNDDYKAFITQCLDNVPLSDESFKAMHLLTWDKSFHNESRETIEYNSHVDTKNFNSLSAMHLLTNDHTDAIVNVSANDPETELAVLSTVKVNVEVDNDRSDN